MPRIKKATDAKGTVFYPISIPKGIYDIDRNQRLNKTLDALESADKTNQEKAADANGLAMCMALSQLANCSITSQTTNPEWSFVLVDSEDRILCGIKEDGTPCVYATVKEMIDCINASYTT